MIQDDVDNYRIEFGEADSVDSSFGGSK